MDPLKLRIVFALVMAAQMVAVVTFVFGPLRHQFAAGWLSQWGQMWLTAWPVASLAILVLAPSARRISLRIAGLAAPNRPHGGERRG